VSEISKYVSMVFDSRGLAFTLEMGLPSKGLAGLYRLRQSKRDKGPVNTGWDEGLVCMS
jgi:hypothetical protein